MLDIFVARQKNAKRSSAMHNFLSISSFTFQWMFYKKKMFGAEKWFVCLNINNTAQFLNAIQK